MELHFLFLKKEAWFFEELCIDYHKYKSKTLSWTFINSLTHFLS